MKKLREFEDAVTRLEAELGEAAAAAVRPRPADDFDDVAELFGDAEGGAVATKTRTVAEVQRELSKFRRAAELQGGLVSDEMQRVTIAACKAIEPEFAALASKIADKLLEVHKLAKSVGDIYQKLVAAGVRNGGVWFQQESVQSVDFAARNVGALDLTGNSPPAVAIRGYLSKLNLPPRAPARPMIEGKP